MRPRLLIPLVSALLASACASPSVAEAGWRLDPRLCPDLREDVRDSRVVTGRRDLREDRRDVRYVNCPASAFVYTAPRGVVVATRPALPAYYTKVHIGPNGYYAVRRGRRVPIAVVVR